MAPPSPGLQHIRPAFLQSTNQPDHDRHALAPKPFALPPEPIGCISVLYAWTTASATAQGGAALRASTLLDLPLILEAVLAVLAGGVTSMLLDRVCFRPLRRCGAPEFAAIVSSIGGGLILTSIVQQISATRAMRFPFGTVALSIHADPAGRGRALALRAALPRPIMAGAGLRHDPSGRDYLRLARRNHLRSLAPVSHAAPVA